MYLTGEVLHPYSDFFTTKPKVGFDCISLPGYFSGAAYYIYSLAKHLLMIERSFPLVILCKAEHSILFKNLLKDGDTIQTVPANNKIRKTYFYEFRLKEYLLKNNIKLFHSTHYICPPADTSYRLVTTFHDLGFLRFPAYYSLAKRIYFKNRMNTFAERSDLILTVSDTTADDIKKILPESTHKVKVVYPGINHLNDNQENISSEHSPFILSVNTIEKRKNVPFIIKVFNCLKEKYRVKHKLILVGQKSSDYKNVLKEYNKSKFIKDIIIKEYIAEAELVNLYKTADCFLSASEYEGFGFTPLEALRFSCPVFLLKNNVTGELLPSYPYIINKSEPEHWAEFIYTEMMNDYKNFSIPLSLKKFDWESAANRIAFEYEKLLKQNENVFA